MKPDVFTDEERSKIVRSSKSTRWAAFHASRWGVDRVAVNLWNTPICAETLNRGTRESMTLFKKTALNQYFFFDVSARAIPSVPKIMIPYSPLSLEISRCALKLAPLYVADSEITPPDSPAGIDEWVAYGEKYRRHLLFQSLHRVLQAADQSVPLLTMGDMILALGVLTNWKVACSVDVNNRTVSLVPMD
jgi:hypothetical protein